jgi:hypothetical protein
VVELVPLRPEEAIAAVRAEYERTRADPEFLAEWARAIEPFFYGYLQARFGPKDHPHQPSPAPSRALAMAERDLAIAMERLFRSVVRANSTTETMETSKGGSDPGAG